MGRVLKTIYSMSPAVLQSAAVSLYGFHLYRREYGRKFDLLLDKFNKRQWAGDEELRCYQNEHLARLIRHVYENVPFYGKIMRQRKLVPGDIVTADDLYKLPVLTREDVSDNFEQLLAVNYSRHSLVIGHTNGTTGSPLKLAWDKYGCLVKNVVDWRQKDVAGIKPGDNIAFFFGREVVPVSRNKPPFWRRNRVLNHIFFSTYHLSSENSHHYIEALKELAPKAVEGYPNSLYIIASFLNNNNEKIPLKAVFCTSEPLLPHQRKAIEKAFSCKVYDFYGMAERIIFASECDYHDGKHINSDYGITEINLPDGSPAAEGELGRVVATGLHNYAMPLIRYQTSDFTAIKSRSCSCGRCFPLMENVTARDVAILRATDGRLIIPAILSGIYDSMTNIVEFQIIQEESNLIILNIVRRPSYSNGDTNRLTAEMKRIFGMDMRIEPVFLDTIPRTKSGKFRWMINKVPPKL